MRQVFAPNDTCRFSSFVTKNKSGGSLTRRQIKLVASDALFQFERDARSDGFMGYVMVEGFLAAGEKRDIHFNGSTV